MKNQELYEKITEKIIKIIDTENVLPWCKPWSASGGAFNRITKRHYSLLNQFILDHTGEYASFKQWQSLGGKVKKGEKAEYVYFWKWLQYDEKDKYGRPVRDENGEIVKKNIPYLRYLPVFHISQVEGVESLPTEQQEIHNDPIAFAEDIISDYVNRSGLTFENTKESDRAYYSPSMDMVKVPNINQYKNKEEYYSTTFHELTHSTGAKHRLNRLNTMACFGSNDYSKEELVAEMGSAYLMAYCQIDTDKTTHNSASYIKSWRDHIKKDPSLVVLASSKSQKAVNYILGEEMEEE